MGKNTRPRPQRKRHRVHPPAPAAPVQSPPPPEAQTKSLFKVNPFLWYGLVIVAAIFLVGFSLFIIKLLDTIDEQNQRLVTAQHLAQVLQVRLVSLEEDSRQTSEMVQIISARRLQILLLHATDAHPAGFGKILWDTEGDAAVLQAAGLPAAPAGMRYQLWRERRAYGGRAPACVFPSTGAGIVPLNPVALAGLGAPTSFSLTLDKEGAASPSTDVYLQARP